MVNTTENKKDTPVNPSQRTQAPAMPLEPETLREGEFRNADASDEHNHGYEYEVEESNTTNEYRSYNKATADK